MELSLFLVAVKHDHAKRRKYEVLVGLEVRAFVPLSLTVAHGTYPLLENTR